MKRAHLFLAHLFLLFALSGVMAQARKNTAGPVAADKLPAAEFARLLRELSEQGGEFHSDNLVSNETTSGLVTGKLRQMVPAGGVYIGVGPEQNFTFIAATRPRMAFIVDVRPLSVIQHLIYKAIFQRAATRARFLSLLLSRPQRTQQDPAAHVPLDELLAMFETMPVDEKMMLTTLAELRQVIESEFQYKLSPDQQKGMEYVLKSFMEGGPGISYRLRGAEQRGLVGFRGGGGRGMGFPTLKQLLSQTDARGKQAGFLATRGAYEYVRAMQMNNLIIPLTGDFAGPKTFPALAAYLRKRELRVTTFYLSNVEQYLFEANVFAPFAANVKRLPYSQQAVMIRTVNSRFRHPAHTPGHMFTTILQSLPVFIADSDKGLYGSYQALITTNYITGEGQ
ncbi:MAG: hypothetical protein ACKV2V_27815 [Blastocatellia bacterium]